MNACSERCCWCGRCTTPEVSQGRRELTREIFATIRRGLVQVGLSSDYFGYHDITFLWDQGNTADQIVAHALEHEDRARRFIPRALSR